MRALEMTTAPEQRAVLWSLHAAGGLPAGEGPTQGPTTDFVGFATSKDPLKYLFETEALFVPSPDLADAAATPKPWGRHQSLGRHYYGACVVNAQAMGIVPAQEGVKTRFVPACDEVVEELDRQEAYLDGVYVVPMFGDTPLTTRGDRPSSLQNWHEVFRGVYDVLVEEEVAAPAREALMSRLLDNPRDYAVVGYHDGHVWSSAVHTSIYKQIRARLERGNVFGPLCPKLGAPNSAVLTKVVSAIMRAPVIGVKEGVGENTASPVPFSAIRSLDDDDDQCMRLVATALATQEGCYHPEHFTFRGYIPSTKFLCTRLEQETTYVYVSRKPLRVGDAARKGGTVTSCSTYKSCRALFTYTVEDIAAFNRGHRAHKLACLAHANNVERAVSLGFETSVHKALVLQNKRKREAFQADAVIQEMDAAEGATHRASANENFKSVANQVRPPFHRYLTQPRSPPEAVQFQAVGGSGAAAAPPPLDRYLTQPPSPPPETAHFGATVGDAAAAAPLVKKRRTDE